MTVFAQLSDDLNNTAARVATSSQVVDAIRSAIDAVTKMYRERDANITDANLAGSMIAITVDMQLQVLELVGEITPAVQMLAQTIVRTWASERGYKS